MGRPERPPAGHVVSMADVAVAAFLEATEAEQSGVEVAEHRTRALALLAKADRAFREQAIFLERVEETADRLATENAEMRRQLATRELQVDSLIADRDDARAWARGFEHGMFGRRVDTNNPPEWLMTPLTFDE